MAQTAVATREQQFYKDIWTKDAFSQAIAACGTKDSAKQLMASVLDVYHEGGDFLQSCDSKAILAECLKAAQLNLPLIKSLGYAYIVPFKGVPTFVIGWKGLVQLAQNTGKFKYINADAIYEGEEVKFDRLSGTIQISGEPTSDKAIGYFAYIKLLNGFEKTVYMTREDIERYAVKYSPQSAKAGKLTGVWRDNFDAMAKKTVLRKVLKYAPSSTQMEQAEMQEVRNAEVFAQAEVVQNANTGDVVGIPEQKTAQTPAPDAEEAPAPAPEF